MLFNFFDKDCDGFINPQEYAKLVDTCGGETTHEQNDIIVN